MRQQIKFLLSFLSFSLLYLLTTSCINDNIIDKVEHEHQHKYAKKTVPISEVPNLIPHIQKFNKNYNYLSRSYTPDNSAKIEDLNLDLNNIIQYFHETGMISYSVAINKTLASNEAYNFENLHVVENSNGIESFIFQWIPDNSEQLFHLPSFTGTLKKYDINYNLISTTTFINGISQQTNKASTGKSNNGNETAKVLDVCIWCSCNGAPFYCYCTICDFIVGYCDGGGGGGTGTGTGSSGLGTGGGGGGTGGGSSTGDTSEDGGITVVIPNVPVLVDEEEPTPCNQLKKLTNTSSIKVALKNLKDNHLNTASEFGYSVSTFNNSTNIAPPLVIMASTDNPHEIVLPSGGNIIGALHVHTINGSLMFSAADIRSLCVMASANSNNLDYATFFITLTTNDGTFALKIDDFSALYDVMINQEKYMNFKNDLDKEYKSEDLPHTSVAFQKVLLKVMQNNNVGVSLYKANADLSGWSKLSLDPANPNNSPVATPCE